MWCKVLSPENWLVVDEVFAGSVHVTVPQWLALSQKLLEMGPCRVETVMASILPVKPEEWLSRVLRHRLDDRVSEGVRRLFVAAQGMLVYGCLFYPLCTLAVAQLLRLLDRAVEQKVVSSGGRAGRFVDNVAWLEEHGVIDARRRREWDNLRVLRNMTSHPESQTLVPPQVCEFLFESVSQDLNALFS